MNLKELDDSDLATLKNASSLMPGDYLFVADNGKELKTVLIPCPVQNPFGYKDAELKSNVASDPLSLVFPDDLETFKDCIHTAEQDGLNHEVTYRVVKKDGSIIWSHMAVSFLGLYKKDFLLYLSFSNPAGEWNIYKNIPDVSPYMVYVIDMDTFEILYFNNAAKHFLFSDSPVKFGKCYKMVWGKEAPCESCIINEIKAGSVVSKDMFIPSKSTWVHRSARQVSWGSHRAMAVFYSDITESKTLQHELEDSQKRNELAVQAAHLGVWTYNIKEHSITTNNHAFHKYGIPDVIKDIPNSILKFFPPEEQPKVVKFYQDVDSGQPEVTGEFWMAWGKGIPLQCERAIYKVFKNENNEPVIAYGVGRNITAEKNAESRYSETVRELLSLSPNALCTFRLNLTKNLCSEEHGTSQYIEKLIFSDTADNLFANIENIILDQEQKESFKAVFSRPTLIAAFEKGQSRFSLKYRRLVESGDTHWVRTSLNMFLNPTTNDLEAIIYSVDIDYSVTEESIIDCIINEEFDALALIDTKKGTVSFKSVSPQSVDTLPNKEPIYDDDIRYAFPLVDPDNWQADIDSLNLAHLIAELKTKSIYSYAFNVCDSKNQTFRKILKFCYLDDSHNEILLCRSDITEEFASHNKQLAETKAALEEAEKANQSKSVFLSNVSHDMRTPLNGIIGYISLAQKENKDPKVSDYLKKASFSSDILLKLVNDTLDLNKLENGKVTISNEPVETSDLIAKISDAVQVSMAQKSIVFKMDYDEKENMKINADPLVIDEIFINLLSNAVKFTPENGHITMSAHPVKIEKGIVTWRIAIKDDGVGMSDDFLNNHIFEPFSQERTKATSKIGGSGLGLSIVKHLVAICGGTITVHSEVGKGTEFVINMPHELLDQHPERKGGESRQDKRVSDLSSLVGKKVLLVEDNEMNSEIAASVLSAKGLVVDCASDGTEAVSHFAFSGKNEYSVILMDIRMPVLNGYEATKQIRQLSRPDAKTIPIIAMSADAYAEDVKKSLEAGMNDHISKPLDPEKLFAALLKFVK